MPNLTVGDLIPYLDDNELLLVEDMEDTKLFSNYSIAGREEYKLSDDIDPNICVMKIHRISSTDLGEVRIVVKEGQ